MLTGLAEVTPRGTSFDPALGPHGEYAGGFVPRARAAELDAEHETARRDARALLDGVALQVARRPELAEQIERDHGAAIAEARALLARDGGRK